MGCVELWKGVSPSIPGCDADLCNAHVTNEEQAEFGLPAQPSRAAVACGSKSYQWRHGWPCRRSSKAWALARGRVATGPGMFHLYSEPQL